MGVASTTCGDEATKLSATKLCICFHHAIWASHRCGTSRRRLLFRGMSTKGMNRQLYCFFDSVSPFLNGSFYRQTSAIVRSCGMNSGTLSCEALSEASNFHGWFLNDDFLILRSQNISWWARRTAFVWPVLSSSDDDDDDDDSSTLSRG